MTESQAVRANRDGHPCPSWCVTDHARYTFHGSERIAVEAPQFYRHHVRAVQYTAPVPPGIHVDSVFVDHGNAEDLAVLIERLAGATPNQLRELAAAIRQAAADIEDER